MIVMIKMILLIMMIMVNYHDDNGCLVQLSMCFLVFCHFTLT